MAYLSAAIAAVLVGMSKTGVPGVSLPAVLMMSTAFPGREKLSVGALLPVLLVGDLFAIWYYRRHTQWNRLLRLFPFVACGIVPGIWVLGTVDHRQFRILLGTMVLVLLVWELWRRRTSDGSPQPAWLMGLLGVLAGFGTAVGNAAGPAMTIYLIGCGLPKQQFMGIWAWFFMIVNLVKLPAYAQLSIITPETLYCDLMVLPALVVGALLGRRLFLVVPQWLFDGLVMVLAAAAGLQLIAGSLF